MITDKILAEKVALETNSGYWSVNNTYFLNKAECLRHATQIKDYNVQFHYFDSFYSSLTWNNEPKESLEELYKRRAQQLREKYDYIILAYSGGADSCNVLNSFLNNGIPIDDIVTSYPVRAIEKLKPFFNKKDRKASNLIFEFSEAAEPKLKEVARKHPNVKISILDHTETAIDLLSDSKLHIMPVAGIGASPSLAGHYLIAQKVREYSERGGKAVLLTGVDKPRMGFNPANKKFGVWFDDITLVWGNHVNEAHSGYKPATEHFYYSLDMPEIWQKQCHIMRRTMEPIVNLDERPDFYNDIHYKSYRGNEVFYVHNMFFKKILYKDWTEDIFQAEKPSGYFFQEHSDWFFKTNLTDQRTKDFHYGQVMEFVSGIDPRFIVYDDTGKPLKFTEMQTKVITIS
jgi:hypothetical protein